MSSAATSPDNAPKRILKAEWLFSAACSLERAHGVLIQGDRIIAVDDAKTLQRDHPDAVMIDFGDAIILPGLINPHTHLELSNCNSTDAADLPFEDWILTIPARSGTDGGAPQEVITQAVHRGVAECIRFGVTSVGDISKFAEQTRTVLRDGPLRTVSYGETLGLAKARERYHRQLAAAIDRRLASEHLRIALSPHAPYTIEFASYQQCLRVARQNDLPLATHLAETPHESHFLNHLGGAFRRVWEKIGLWHDDVATFEGSPVQFAQAVGLLDYPSLLAHVNYADDADLGLLAAGRASVVYCPRTHQYFGHPPHRWREMLARGINVAIGTDSRASSPDLNLVDDLRLLHGIAPTLPAETLFEMATLRAARALTQDRLAGSLEPGKFADFVIFDATTDSPLNELLESKKLPRETWIAGARITSPPADPPPAG
jgi:cytosine/adenosine deaminase-related metal-dependent hydrolase